MRKGHTRNEEGFIRFLVAQFTPTGDETGERLRIQLREKKEREGKGRGRQSKGGSPIKEDKGEEKRVCVHGRGARSGSSGLASGRHF